jgi:hypothetical protein
LGKILFNFFQVPQHKENTITKEQFFPTALAGEKRYYKGRFFYNRSMSKKYTTSNIITIPTVESAAVGSCILFVYRVALSLKLLKDKEMNETEHQQKGRKSIYCTRVFHLSCVLVKIVAPISIFLLC